MSEASLISLLFCLMICNHTRQNITWPTLSLSREILPSFLCAPDSHTPIAIQTQSWLPVVSSGLYAGYSGFLQAISSDSFLPAHPTTCPSRCLSSPAHALSTYNAPSLVFVFHGPFPTSQALAIWRRGNACHSKQPNFQVLGTRS